MASRPEAHCIVARVVWQFKDPVTSNLVLIGNWPAAVPSLSPDLATKSVRGVLSLIEKSEMEERATALQKVYHGQPYARQDGVVYCHIRTRRCVAAHHSRLAALPDAINPSMVFRDRPELAELLERSTVWIDRSLKHGNVLVHCQKGQKRSPTIVLAWLITKGFGASDAINLISRGYTNSREYSVTDPGRSWGERYRKERPLWVEVRCSGHSYTQKRDHLHASQRLGEWARSWRSLQAAWVAKHGKLLQSWDVLHRAAVRPAAAEPEAKRAKSEDKDKEKEKGSAEAQPSQVKT